jgi:hypothetical protein
MVLHVRLQECQANPFSKRGQGFRIISAKKEYRDAFNDKNIQGRDHWLEKPCYSG